MKKTVTVIVTALLLALILCGCRGEGKLRRAYRSEDSGTVLVRDGQGILYLLTEDDVIITDFSYNASAGTMRIGENTFDYETEEDETVLRLGGERFVSTHITPAMQWRMMIASIQTYIGQVGVLRWLAAPVFHSGVNSVGHYAIFGAVAVDVAAIVVFTFLLGLILMIIHGRR